MSENFKVLGLGQVSRTVQNIEKSEAWYKNILRLKHLYTFGDLTFFECGETRIMLSQSDNAPSSESILYLRVPNIAAAHKNLASQGVIFKGAPHMIHKHESGAEEWMVFFEDLEGRPIALMATTEV